MSEIKKKLLLGIPYAVIWYLADKISWLYRHVPGDMTAKRISNTVLYFNQAFQNRFPSFHIADILAGLIGAAIVWGIIWYRKANAKKFREGVEYGSARWSA